MPTFRDPRNGLTMTLGDHETGGIKTLLRLGWTDVSPVPAATMQEGIMPVFQNPKTGELAEVGIHETERIEYLQHVGWKDVSGLPVTVGIVVEEEIKEPKRIGDPVLVVTEKPIEETTQQLPTVEVAKPKRNKS